MHFKFSSFDKTEISSLLAAHSRLDFSRTSYRPWGRLCLHLGGADRLLGDLKVPFLSTCGSRLPSWQLLPRPTSLPFFEGFAGTVAWQLCWWSTCCCLGAVADMLPSRERANGWQCPRQNIPKRGEPTMCTRAKQAIMAKAHVTTS